MTHLQFWLLLTVGCAVYGFVNDAPPEVWLAGPYWSALTLLGVNFVR